MWFQQHCFSDDDLFINPLVSPGGCKVDTKWIHMECLRKWHKTGNESDICSVTSVMASCSVCKSSYKSSVPLPDGSSANIFNSTLPPPYVSFLVVTKHEMAKQLFNTRFQLSFATVMKPDGKNSNRDLSIGRSSTSDMVLDYRTVSAHHAQVRFHDGQFQFVDAQSSNGSFLYLRKPVQLDVNTTTNLRLGRSLLSLKVTRNKWRSQLISSMSRKLSRSFSADSSRTKEATAADNHAPGNDSFDEEDALHRVKPNTEEHFMLIQNLARPSTTIAAQSPSHASNQKQYDATTGFFKSESGDALDGGALEEALASAGNNSDDAFNSSSNGTEDIGNRECQSNGEGALGGGRQQEGSSPLNGDDGAAVIATGGGDGGGAAAAAVATTTTTANNTFMQSETILPAPGFERRDTLLLPPDQELLMSFQQNDEVEEVETTFVIHPEREARAEDEEIGEEDMGDSASSLDASNSNNSSDMVESLNRQGSPHEVMRQLSRRSTVNMPTPKGQPSWDDVHDVHENVGDGAEEKRSANEVHGEEEFKGDDEEKAIV